MLMTFTTNHPCKMMKCGHSQHGYTFSSVAAVSNHSCNYGLFVHVFVCLEQNDQLLGQAMACAGMIGEAVGRTRFKSDGLAIMATLTVRIVSSDL